MLGAILAVSSCNKEYIKRNRQISQRDLQVDRQLRGFKTALNLKSPLQMSLDSALWYIEGLLNQEKAYNYHNFINLRFHKDSVIQITTNDSLTNVEIQNVYESFLNILNEYSENHNNTTFGFNLIDISAKDTNLKDGSVTILMALSESEDLIGNYYPFTQEDYWVWGWGLGKCGEYVGGTGLDATDELEYKINYPALANEPGFFTSNEIITAYPMEFEDAYNPTQWGDYMMFFYDLNVAPVEEPCLSPSDLNYYLSKFDYIKNSLKPIGKTFNEVDVFYDVFVGNEGRLHGYDIKYGIFTVSPPND